MAMIDDIIDAESGGDPNAVNPHSTASGLFQYTDPTFMSLAQKYPEVGADASNRNDPAIQTALFNRQLSDEFAPALHKASLAITPQNVYVLHHMGTPSGIKLLTTDPSKAASTVLGNSWPSIQAANPALFKNDGATVGDVVSAVQGHLMGSSGAQDGPSAASAPPVDYQDTGSDPVEALPTPSAKVDPNANSSVWDRLANWAAAWGSGADGQDAAAGLGRGAANAMQALKERRAQSQAIQDFNDSLPRQAWDNKVAALKLNSDLQGARTARGSTIGSLLAKGIDPKTAIALVSGSGQVSGLSQQALAGKNASKDAFEAPTQWAVDNEDGTTTPIMASHNRANGQERFVNMQTGEVMKTLPKDAYRPDQIDAKGIAEQSNKDAADYANEVAALQKSATQAHDYIRLIPSISAGSALTKRASRALSLLTGKSWGDGTNPDAIQAADMIAARMRQTGLSALHGRQDLPMVKNAFASSLGLDTNPVAATWAALTAQREADANQAALDAWSSLPSNSQYKTRKGFSAFKASYLKDNPAAPVSLDEAEAYYKSAVLPDREGFSAQQDSTEPVQAPSSNAASKMGSGTLQWNGQPVTFTPD